MADSEERDNADTAASTPNSQRQDSIGPKASKDRSCPFCGQAFTSSSLGRHLDLYIKPRNPKPADGVHNVDEIRKLRGGITRRQPKTSLKSGANVNASGWRQDSAGSTPNTTYGHRSMPRVDARMTDGSPVTSPVNMREGEGMQTSFNQPNWQATGVINNLPPRAPSRNHDTPPTGQAQRIQEMRRDNTGGRVQRPDYDNEHLWKLQEDAEVGRAAELALREVLGSLEAAKKKVEPTQLFEGVDFYNMSFPGLCLSILARPPTLCTATPFPGPCSWSFAPPGKKEFENVHRRINERVLELRKAGGEEAYSDSWIFRHNTHLQGAFEHWQLMSEQDQAYAWTLEILRAFTREKEQKQQAVEELEAAQNRIRHLEAEYDRLSRCQLPREYLMHPPNTVPAPAELVRALNNTALRSGAGDLDYDADALLSKWRTTVRATNRRPPIAPSRTNQGGETYNDRPSADRMHGDMVLNGAIFGIGGPMPRGSTNHSHDPHDHYVNYETPPNPGAIVGADDEDEADADAEGEADEEQQHAVEAHQGALTRRTSARVNAARSAEAGHWLNFNGKRPHAPTPVNGRSGGAKVYKAHYLEHEVDGQT